MDDLFSSLPEQCNHYLRLAMLQDIGLVLRCPAQEAFAAALSRERAKRSPLFSDLQIRLWPNYEIALVKGGSTNAS